MYRYWTLSKRLMPGPYIRSRRSNKVVSRVRGGRKPECLEDFFFAGSFECSGSGAVDSSTTTASPCIEFDSELVSVSEFVSVASSSFLSVEGALPLPGLEGFPEVPLPSGPFSRCFSDDFACLFFFLCLSKERIVGGSCIGSPAKTNFFPLNIGTQHT